MTNFTEFYTSLAKMWPVTRSGSDIASHPDKSIQPYSSADDEPLCLEKAPIGPYPC